jgi:hypothetical protein
LLEKRCYWKRRRAFVWSWMERYRSSSNPTERDQIQTTTPTLPEWLQGQDDVMAIVKGTSSSLKSRMGLPCPRSSPSFLCSRKMFHFGTRMKRVVARG